MDNVLWIEGDPAPGLAIVLRPRGGEGLREDLLGVKQAGVETLVSLLEKREARWLGLAEERALAEEIGLRFVSYPIRDTKLPAHRGGFREFVAGLAERLRAGERIGVHCRGSIGRTTVTAACTLIHLGWKAEDALEAVETARCRPVPDTEEQLRWILNYKAEP